MTLALTQRESSTCVNFLVRSLQNEKGILFTKMESNYEPRSFCFVNPNLR